MQSYNLIYKNNKNLEEFIKTNNIDKSNTILVQIFSGILEDKILINISQNIKKLLPSSKILGTTTAGEVYNGKMYDEQIVISFSIFNCTSLKSNIYELKDNKDCVKYILDDLVTDDTKAMIIFSDGLLSNGEEIINEITQINPDLIIAGGRAGDNQQFVKTFVFNETKSVQKGCVVVALNSKDLIVHNNYILNWETIGQDMTITASDKNHIIEINHKKPIDLYRKYLGDDIVDGLPFSGIEFPLIMQKNGVTIARAPISVLDDGTFIFAGNITQGSKVKFGFGNVETIKDSSYKNYEKLKDIPIESTFIYSCSARKALMSDELEVEFGLLQNIAPTVGYFTYGEYYHNNIQNELLNITTTFLSLSETKEVKKPKEIENKHSKKNKTLKALTHLVTTTSNELNIAKEKAEDSARAKSSFLANMSHEIRTPLNGILGFVDLLKENIIDTQNKEYLNIIDNSSHHLLGIIEDILDFSKIESGKLEIEDIDFNTNNELQSIIDLFKAKASEKNISLEINIDKNLPKYLNSDPLRIKQILSNLLSNAIKFTSNGKKIFIDINYKNSSLSISVKDQGIGIHKDNLSHIFDSFTQENSSTTREFGGTGLGLSISSELVKLLAGEIKVTSEIGIGSEFNFCIPVKLSLSQIDVEVENKVENKIINEEIKLNGKVLVVEDNKSNQLFMKVILKKMGLEFDIASDGIEAVDKFKENAPTEATLGCRYDAILMDENMPNMNGMEATKKILEIEKENNLIHTPIIALTANALKGDREKFLNAGMDEYLTKPLNKKKLAETLSKVLDMKNS